ncbi:MAG: glycosyltransferase family 4 protein [Desulfuromonadaceae bacterium]|nr:glycosyltransferase family 4 protein [Desulfuromonadaceae bacterium]
MRILHLLSQIPSATGSGIYLQAAMRHAARRGHQNLLLAGVPMDFGAGRHSDQLACEGCHFVRFGDSDAQKNWPSLPHSVVGMSDVMPYPSSRFCDLTPQQVDQYEACFTDHLCKAVEKWQPELIHSHHLWLLTSLAGQLFPELPLVVSCHGTDLRQFRSCPQLQQRALRGSRHINRVYALHPQQIPEIETLYGIESTRIDLVGSGYNEHLFYPYPTTRPQQTIQLVYAGKLSRAKGLPWLLKALLENDDPQWQLHLAGDGQGKEKEEILQLAAQRPNQIRLHGLISQKQLANLLRSSHLCLLPSFYEGLPLILLEALACGCRLLTTELPGAQQLFADIRHDWIEHVPLPPMQGIDVPTPEGEGIFIRSLKQGIQRQFQSIRRPADTDSMHMPDSVARILHQYSWEATVARMEQGYEHAWQEQRAQKQGRN